MRIRAEKQSDIDNIRAVNLQAFDTDAEANLVDALRRSSAKLISLVAEEKGDIIGHILFSPVTAADHNDISIAGLAPMAVVPDWQRKGVGSRLVEEGLEACRSAGYEAVVVLGHPDYYPKFGFEPSYKFSVKSEYKVPPEVFMVKELQEGVLQHLSGTVRYHPLFNEM